MLLKLDGDGVMYRQISRAIRGAVRAGPLAVGARLPSTRNLASNLKVARNTVRAAYDQLANEGLLVSRAGSGCYVAWADTGRAPMPRTTHEAPQSRYAARLRDSARRTLQGVVSNQQRSLRFHMWG